MKNLLDFFYNKNFQNIKPYLYGVIISSLVLFLKNLLTGEKKTYDNITKATTEAIHLNELAKEKSFSFYLKSSVTYALYGIKLIIDNLHSVIIASVSMLTIKYSQKNQSIIGFYLPLNKLPSEFQELTPLIPPLLGTMLGVMLHILFNNIKSVLPSKYDLPTNSQPKSSAVIDAQVNIVRFVEATQSNIKSNVKFNFEDPLNNSKPHNKEEITPQLQTGHYFCQFNPALCRALSSKETRSI